jgi:hypothetical protein
VYFHVNLNFSKFNKTCICWLVNNICFSPVNPKIHFFCEVGNRRLETSKPASQNAVFLHYGNHLVDAVFRVQMFEI